MLRSIAAISALVATARAQSTCGLAEVHPKLNWSKCTSSSCSAVSGSVVIDANWRWSHDASGKNCYSGNTWDSTICNTGKACAEKCCIEGADYPNTYGVNANGDSLSLKFVHKGPYSTNIGSRLYLMENEDKYQMFTLLGNEFSFDVDVSQIGCGLNGAVYFVSMDADGGKSKFPGNKGGAKYGQGYCDSQCPRDIKWLNNVANSDDWVPSKTDINAGVGKQGACCAEMDIWEANKISNAYTPHPCLNNEYHNCNEDNCGGTYSATRYAGDCDPDGCDFNPYRQGDKTFFGPGSNFDVDSNKKVTVVTQFLKGSNGKLSEIRRHYVQNGVKIANSESTIAGNPGDSITGAFCKAQKQVFGDRDSFEERGGMEQTHDAVSKPMVLVLSLWHDHYAKMLWLDSTYPVGATNPGAARGSCSTSSGVPADLERDVPNSAVVFSNIKFGPIGSTGSGTTGPDPSSTSSSSAGSSPTAQPGTVPRYGQCGGINHQGGTVCVAPWTCNKVNDWYSQCL